MIVTRYVCVKVTMEIPRCAEDNLGGVDEVADEVIADCDYNFKYDADGVRIIDTEIIGSQDHAPIGL